MQTTDSPSQNYNPTIRTSYLSKNGSSDEFSETVIPMIESEDDAVLKVQKP